MRTEKDRELLRVPGFWRGRLEGRVLLPLFFVPSTERWAPHGHLGTLQESGHPMAAQGPKHHGTERNIV